MLDKNMANHYMMNKVDQIIMEIGLNGLKKKRKKNTQQLVMKKQFKKKN